MLKAITRALPGTMLDAAGIAGAGLIAYGAWLIYPPAGFITGGALILAGVLRLSTKIAGRGA
jgi:hypothetical protein